MTTYAWNAIADYLTRCYRDAVGSAIHSKNVKINASIRRVPIAYAGVRSARWSYTGRSRILGLGIGSTFQQEYALMSRGRALVVMFTYGIDRRVDSTLQVRLEKLLAARLRDAEP
jgi:hypothetical protein